MTSSEPPNKEHLPELEEEDARIELEDIYLKIQDILVLKQQKKTLPEDSLLYLQELTDRRNELIDFLKKNGEETTAKPNCALLQHMPEKLSTAETCIETIRSSGLVFSELLEISFGNQKVVDTIDRLANSLQKQPFGFIRNTGMTRLLVLLRREHPQTIALILAHLEPKKAAYILQNLSRHYIWRQSDVIQRIATMDLPCPESLYELERVLRKNFPIPSTEDMLGKNNANTANMESVYKILELTNLASETRIIETLEYEAPELAEEIKKRILVFEDIALLSDRDIQKVMREVDTLDLSKVLKSAGIKVRDKFFKNISRRAVRYLEEDMEYMGSIPPIDVEESRQKIVLLVRHLENSGGITIARYGKTKRALSGKFPLPSSKNDANISGLKTVTEILKFVDRAMEAQIIEDLEYQDPDLVEDIKKHLILGA